MGLHVAVDLLGGDDVPATVAGVARALDADDDLDVVLVGPPETATELARHPRVTVVEARERLTGDVDPAKAVRARRDASIRVAARLVRDGVAHAVVSGAPAPVTTAAATFVLGLVGGVTRAALAASVDTVGGRVVVVDAGSCPDGVTTGDVLVQHALMGSVVAATVDGVDDPCVGLLSTTTQPSPSDRLRREAAILLADAPVRFAGVVTADAVVHGGCDVVVTDGFTGDVLLAALRAAAPSLHPGRHRFLVGVDGVVVGYPEPDAVADAVAGAATAARRGLAARTREAATALVDRRRELAGLR